jgi:hypothetical protein
VTVNAEWVRSDVHAFCRKRTKKQPEHGFSKGEASPAGSGACSLESGPVEPLCALRLHRF